MPKRKSEDVSRDGNNPDSMEDSFGFDPVDVEEHDQNTKRPRTKSPQSDIDDETLLLLSPSAFGIEYREPAKEIRSSSPIQDPDSGDDLEEDASTEKSDSGETTSSTPAVRGNEEDDDLEDAITKSLEKRLEPSLGDNGSGRPWGLPKHVLAQILQHVFPVASTVAPWYKCGMLTIGIRGYTMNDEGVTFNPNVDASILRVSKEFHDAGTTLLYGSNHFLFANRADAAKWFLTRIGDDNVKKIRMATFAMNSGWLADRRSMDVIASPFENSFEEDWAKCLDRFRTLGVRFEFLRVILDAWKAMALEGDYDSESKAELDLWRAEVVRRLGGFRGANLVAIQEVGEVWLGRLRAQNLALQMQQA